MISLEEKWTHREELSMAEIFQPDWTIPHKAILEIERELEKTMGREKALELIEKVALKQVEKQVEEMRASMPINSFEDFLKMFQKTSDEHMWDKVNVDEYIRVEGTVRESKTVECIYADVWKKWGAPEVGYAWHCSGDFAFIGGLHPNLRLERPKCLMNGDDCCNFHMIWEEKE
jgi:hypothetical protein